MTLRKFVLSCHHRQHDRRHRLHDRYRRPCPHRHGRRLCPIHGYARHVRVGQHDPGLPVD